ncbi:MAG TPA: hypothetical protein PLF08_03980 [Bacillota bacterium]|nr:hypothetical protein [Bacillota bacterium]HOK64462.1 hypothetical protein [Bacillota bacterium]HOQ02338.1 hypothetical protein [Bacillota bacterium]HPV12776.1 hypothetical protein [Bacillota bacterium]HPZ78106.1 hypothetical protein [Bacillota bacterium]
MSSFKYKFQMYKHLQQNTQKIYEEAKQVADELGIGELKGQIGLTGAISGCPAPMRKNIINAIVEGEKKVVPLVNLVEEIREIVKDVYGDEYDACPVSTCEGGLWVTFDTLFSPPLTGRGDKYRARYIAPLEKHMHHQAGYGRPFPAKYKEILADRGATAGELGFSGKRLDNLDVVIVPLEGAKYPNHGIKYHPVPLLTEVDPEASLESIAIVAETHAPYLTGFTSLGYDTPGYGYGEKDAEGTPVLQKGIGELAKEFNVPYVVDNAWGLPFIGHDPRKTGADVLIYSMDKATGSGTSGLIIGREDVMVPIRRALGMHGDRYGTTASYGKAAYVTLDPGKEALLTQVAVLKDLRDNPEIYTKQVDQLYEIVTSEVEKANPKLKQGLKISKSYNSSTVEINYEDTWKDQMGFPIFSIEDMYAGSHLLQVGCSQMGIIATISYDANIFISPGQGTCDEEGNIIEEKMRLAIKGLFALMEIIGRYSGFLS